MQLSFGSLFAGIGGFDLGFERAGMVCKWQVEIDDYANRILEKHWPKVRRWRDVRTWPQPDTERVDVICGGLPCQDVSTAGCREGVGGERSGLYVEMLRTVRDLRPAFAVIENVSGLLSDGLATVLRDLDECGYDSEWEVITACAFGAPHTRRRVFIVAYPHGDGSQGVFRWVAQKRRETVLFESCDTPQRRKWQQLPQPIFCRSSDGIPSRVDKTRCLGNAVVPQAAEYVGRLIVESYKRMKANAPVAEAN